MRIVTAAEVHDWLALVYQLPHAFWPLWRSARPLELMLDLHRRGPTAARHCGHRAAERGMLTTGVIAMRGLNRYREAVQGAESALALARQDDDRRAEAQALHELGVCHHALADAAAAVEVLTRAIAIRTTIGYARGVALSQLVLGQVALDTGETDTTISELAHARQSLRTKADRLSSARAAADWSDEMRMLQEFRSYVTSLAEHANEGLAPGQGLRPPAEVTSIRGMSHRRAPAAGAPSSPS